MDDEESVLNSSPKRSDSPATTVTQHTGEDTVLKKHPDSQAGSRPGTTKARPIPEMPNTPDAFPRDPDKDHPDVHVSF